MRKNTIQSISEQTGYSVSTVSRVLSGKAQRSRISQKAIEIIQAEAKRINYTPNLLAQGLRTSRTYTIGLTVLGIDNPFFATLASTVIENLKLAGYHTLLADSLENEKDFESSLMMFRSRSVDGIIAVPVGNTTELMDEITGNIPTVLIDRYFEGTSLPYICTDNYAVAIWRLNISSTAAAATSCQSRAWRARPLQWSVSEASRTPSAPTAKSKLNMQLWVTLSLSRMVTIRSREYSVMG